MPTIQLHSLTLGYVDQQPLITNVDVTFPSQQISLLIGPSGMGKSTLCELITEGNIDDNLAIKGTITFDGKEDSEISKEERSKWVAMLFQNPDQQFAMPTGRQEIQFALENICTPVKEISKRIEQAVKITGIQNIVDHPVNHLSGGEQQKIALAVIIAMDSKIIVLDEPFANIDQQSRKQLMNVLRQLKKTIIIVDHDLSGYEDITKNIFELKQHTIKQLSKSEINSLTANFNQEQLQFVKVDENPSFQFNLQLNQLQLNNYDQVLLNVSDFKWCVNAITIIQGENGVGKSTLFKAMTKAFPYTGTILYDKKSIQKIKTRQYLKHVALLFQEANTQFIMMTVKEEIQLSKQNSVTNLFSDELINKWLKQLNLFEHKDQVVYTLSGGQKKKLQILLMLIMGQKILLMDEPFAGLDYHSIQVVCELLIDAKNKFGQTIIIITHQLNGLESIIDHYVQFKNKTLTEMKVVKK